MKGFFFVVSGQNNVGDLSLNGSIKTRKKKKNRAGFFKHNYYRDIQMDDTLQEDPASQKFLEKYWTMTGLEARFSFSEP